MIDDHDALNQILRKVHSALQKTVSNAPTVHSDYAATLLDFTNQYLLTQGTGSRGRLVWDPSPEHVRGLAQEVVNLVKNDKWQSALEQSHAVLSILPGEPGGIPKKPPKLPW